MEYKELNKAEEEISRELFKKANLSIVDKESNSSSSEEGSLDSSYFEDKHLSILIKNKEYVTREITSDDHKPKYETIISKNEEGLPIITVIWSLTEDYMKIERGEMLDCFEVYKENCIVKEEISTFSTKMDEKDYNSLCDVMDRVKKHFD